MSEQGIIVILIFIWVTLLACWVSITTMLRRDRDRFTDIGAGFDEHDNRILMIEENDEVADKKREEMLDILRKKGGI